MGTIYGYARVSSRDQNEARQMIALHERGIADDHIFLDKKSGKDFNRPQYQAMLRKLAEGDVVVIKSIDRLGRNYDEILEQWRQIVKDKACDIIVLDMPLLDTTNTTNGLMGKVISDIVLQLLSYVAQTEREYIKQRQAEGIAAARSRGQRFGRPTKRASCPAYPEYFRRWQAGELSMTQCAKALGIAHTTFSYWTRQDTERPAPSR